MIMIDYYLNEVDRNVYLNKENKDYGSINRFSVATDDYRRRNSSAILMDSDSKVGPQVLAAFAGTYLIYLF